MTTYFPTATTLLLFAVGTWLTIRHFKIVRTVSYIERMNNSSMVAVRAAVDEWLEREEPIQSKLQALREDPALNIKVTLLYNILTELAIAHQYRVVNRRMTYDIWFPLVPRYWHRLRFYIADARRTGSPIGYSLEDLANRIEDYNRKQGKLLRDVVAQRLNQERSATDPEQQRSNSRTATIE